MRIPPSVLALVLCGATTSLGAQVVISEIHLSPATATEAQWIELVNLGTAPQDLSNWSIYQATKTPNRPQNYWFAIPAQTVLPAGKIMRIAWGAKITSTNPLDIETGDNVKNFLFGLGFEPFNPKKGALALMNTNLNSKVNDPASFEDWVSWGESGFKRESLAVTAELWTENQFIPAPTAKESIALASYLQEEPTPLSAFFLDHTPTPLVNNHLDAIWTDCPVPPCPKPCATGGAKLARLWFAGVPTDGNTDFAFTIDNTRGPVFREVVFLLINTGIGNQDKFMGCPIHVTSIASSVIYGPIPTTFNTTRIPVSLNVPGAAGVWLDYQAVVGSFGSLDISTSNLLDLRIGR
ncbi:MAG: lamin tail domain-containing protein [Planctomycetota bacterium]|jgi:hypothetical protein